MKHEVCIVALAETFRGDGEILASGIGVIPALAAKLARATCEPELMLTDGVATLVEADGTPSGWMPYRAIFDLVWSGRRHVIMGASQIDRFGNQNIAAIGDPRRPKAQLLGMRGAPGNTINHPTTYWIPQHSRRSFVAKVDVVSGVGNDRAKAIGARFHELRRVVTDLCVLDFATPDRSMRLVSVHPGVTLADVVEKTGFALTFVEPVPVTRLPTDDERALIATLDPHGKAAKELS